MKILLINTLYYPNTIGGAEKSVQILAEELVQKGHKVIVITLLDKKNNYKEIINGVNVYYLAIKNLYFPFNNSKKSIYKPLWHLIDIYNYLMAKEVEKIIRKERPDVVNTNNLAGFSVAVWDVVKKSGIPLVHTIRDYYLMCPSSSMFKIGKNCTSQCGLCNIYSIPKKLLSDKVDYVIGISSFILNKHEHLGFFKKVEKEVIYNSINLQTQVNKKDQSNLISIGFIGRLEKSKGIEIFINLFDKIKEENVKFIVGGKGNKYYENILLNMSISNNNFSYLGFVEPNEFFTKIDVLIVPSLWEEPLGRIVLEAYAHGVPVIGANRGGISELVKDGQTGFLANNLIELEEKVKKFLIKPNLLSVMKPIILEKAKKFSSNSIAEKYLNIYTKLINEGKI